jgi:hypothetical protein
MPYGGGSIIGTGIAAEPRTKLVWEELDALARKGQGYSMVIGPRVSMIPVKMA